jgi:hypothetical protein
MKLNYLLKQSTKKIFFLILIIPILFQLVLINLVQVANDEKIYYLIFVFFWMLYLPYFYWLNISINFIYLNSNKFFNLKLINFKITLFINIITSLNFVLFVAYIFSFVFNGGRPDTDVIQFIIFIQFIGVFSFFYNNYFVFKLLASTELKRKTNFSDFSGILFIYSFPPLTVWIIQNKIKKIQLNQ